METIAQISTPLGSGGIAVVRMSGDNSLDIAFKLFSCKNLNKQTIEPRKLYLGNFCFDGVTEKCLMAYFKCPFSYTGEDIVEFQIHGGEFLATFVLNALLSSGAVLAENGEFSRRAFLNGKMSLDEAEGMIDIINATSKAELKAASKLLVGELTPIVKDMQSRLKDALADLEVAIDYPENDDDVMSIAQVKNVLADIKCELQKLYSSRQNGKVIKFGISVAIVGKPNVGKSSLLNALIGEDVAIVTNIKGTTRDIVKETISYNGIKINFLDTAGIRESEDEVEKIGIEKSKTAIENADVVLAVFDSSCDLDQEDKQLLELVENKNKIIVLNKTDLKQKLFIDGAIEISAKNKHNTDIIKTEILKCAKADNIDFQSVIITNQRHNQVIKTALEMVDKAIDECDHSTADIVDHIVKDIWRELGKITGESEVENIIDAIFSKFCLGK